MPRKKQTNGNGHHVKRGPGRPPKHNYTEPYYEEAPRRGRPPKNQAATAAPKKRGRPPKTTTQPTQQAKRGRPPTRTQATKQHAQRPTQRPTRQKTAQRDPVRKFDPNELQRAEARLFFSEPDETAPEPDYLDPELGESFSNTMLQQDDPFSERSTMEGILSRIGYLEANDHVIAQKMKEFQQIMLEVTSIVKTASRYSGGVNMSAGR